MEFCSDCVGEDGACCDFCFHYKFNAGENGVYTGNGYCKYHKENFDPYDICDNFKCKHGKVI